MVAPARLAWTGLGAGLGVAATLAALALLPGGGGAPAPALAVGPVAAGSALEAALASARSGEAVAAGPGVELTVLASLPAEGGLCREFEARETAAPVLRLGLACQEGGGWTVDVLIAETIVDRAPSDGAFLPAAGAAGGLLDPWLDRRGAGMALTPAEEAERLGAAGSR
jgi:hypothetical protein